MGDATLGEFISIHREELLYRCRAKGLASSEPQPTASNVARGIPRFLDDVVGELTVGPSKKREMDASATAHGADLFFDGLTVGQVVHAYGGVCQSVTDLAVEMGASISSDDFRTLNRCLDDAIAHAVVEFGRQQRVAGLSDSGFELNNLRNLIDTALSGFEALKTGTVALGGTTGALVHRSLLALRDAMSIRTA